MELKGFVTTPEANGASLEEREKVHTTQHVERMCVGGTAMRCY